MEVRSILGAIVQDIPSGRRGFVTSETRIWNSDTVVYRVQPRDRDTTNQQLSAFDTSSERIKVVTEATVGDMNSVENWEGDVSPVQEKVAGGDTAS